jgi:hypothetical protein
MPEGFFTPLEAHPVKNAARTVGPTSDIRIRFFIG